MNPDEARNRRILLVDDQEQIHEDYRKILALSELGGSDFDRLEAEFFGDDPAEPTAALPRPQYQIDSASQGEQAIEMVRAALDEGHPYALTFMDVRMPPGIDGIETIRRIREFDSELQVVISTAYADYVWEDIHAIFGASDDLLFLRKPFDATEVQQLASTMTEKWNLRREARLKRDQLETLVEQRTAELRQTLEQLQTAQTQLFYQEKMAALGQLVAGVTHEINTPVGVMLSATDVIERACKRLELALNEALGEDHTKQWPSIRIALRSLRENTTASGVASQRVHEVISSLRRFIHLDEAEYQHIDLHECLDAALALQSHELGERIRLRCDYGELPEIACYPGQLNQLFLNLIGNAINAIEESGEIRIETHQPSVEEVEVVIRDSGRGIAPERLETLFDVQFSRQAGKRVKLGMGLPTSRQIAERHGGSIQVASEPGSGTSFTIRLPLRAPR